jgi:hypothetical protein
MNCTDICHSWFPSDALQEVIHKTVPTLLLSFPSYEQLRDVKRDIAYDHKSCTHLLQECDFLSIWDADSFSTVLKKSDAYWSRNTNAWGRKQ